MMQVCGKLTDYCFTKLNLNRVEIQCARGNVKNQAIPDRLNFNMEGTLRQAQLLNNKLSTCIYMRLLNMTEKIPTANSSKAKKGLSFNHINKSFILATKR